FFVRLHRSAAAQQPAISDPPPAPNEVTGQQLAMQLIKAANDPKLLPLGAAVPHAQFMPVQAVAAAMARALRQHGAAAAAYTFPPGHLNLRRQIAKRMTELGCPTDPEGIVITNGCQEALGLALRALTQPGDVVAIESPTFYGLLQVIEALGLKALEIPTDPRDGMSVEALEFALQQWPVRVCIVTPNFSNPLGSCMSTERKRALVKLLEQRDIPLIEDDVYGDLGFEGSRPGIAKALDPSGNTVIYCSSFSKTLTPGLRVGWIAAGRQRAEIEYHKYVLNLASPTASQMAVAELLERGGYDRYLRQARRDYATAVARMSRAVELYFPEGTRVTQPQGGFVIWIEFPAAIDSNALYRQALQHGISIAPGTMFSATGRYRNFIRLNCAVPWDTRTEKSIARLGQLALAML
ncbi:MAG TPA: PLP-dependent aminotransferase family protein, partial [Spongiibacteraceae bacterium]|nr:PLP-dependent aminotransferase family protein [Spongiibacteraceae bacterium]